MNSKALDLLVPFAYVIAILVAIFTGNEEWIGIVATIGAILVAAYYAALRPSMKKSQS